MGGLGHVSNQWQNVRSFCQVCSLSKQCWWPPVRDHFLVRKPVDSGAQRTVGRAVPISGPDSGPISSQNSLQGCLDVAGSLVQETPQSLASFKKYDHSLRPLTQCTCKLGGQMMLAAFGRFSPGMRADIERFWPRSPHGTLKKKTVPEKSLNKHGKLIQNRYRNRDHFLVPFLGPS